MTKEEFTDSLVYDFGYKKVGGKTWRLNNSETSQELEFKINSSKIRYKHTINKKIDLFNLLPIDLFPKPYEFELPLSILDKYDTVEDFLDYLDEFEDKQDEEEF